MPIVVAITHHTEDDTFVFCLNRPLLLSASDPAYDAKMSAFTADLYASGFEQVALSYSEKGRLYLIGTIPGPQPQKYVKIIDVLKAHMKPPAKETLSTFRQEP